MTLRVRTRDLLAAASAFLVVVAFMMHVLMADRFAASWPLTDVVSTSVATTATYIDPSTFEAHQGTSLVRQRSTARTSSTVEGADAVLVSTSTLTSGGQVVARARWSAVQRRFSGVVVDSPANMEKVASLNTSGDSVESQRTLSDVQGLLVRFPRQTRPTTYRRWDPETRQTGDALFERRARLEGAEVLVFRQREVGTIDAATGTKSSSDTLLWVRPEVGAVVKSSTHVVIRPAAGGPASLDARFVDDAASVRAASAAVDAAVHRNRVVGTEVPVVVLFLGMLVALVAVLEGRTGRLRRRSGRVRPKEAQ